MIDEQIAVTAVLLDDSNDDRTRYSELLSDAQLKVTPLEPGGLVETVSAITEILARAEGPGLVLLDYRLDEDPDTHYRGGSIAAALREREQDLPIVLLTTETKLHESVDHHAGVEDLFDWRLLKGQVPTRRDLIREQLRDLAITYWKLSNVEAVSPQHGWARVSAAMGATTEEIEDLSRRESYDPRDQSAAQLGRWIHFRPLRHIGPLLDDFQVRAVLGLDEASYSLDQVQDALGPCRYEGLMASFEARWWSHRVRALVADVVGTYGPTDSTIRADGLSAKLDVELTAAGCVWCGSGRTLRACFSCGQPVDASHAIATLTEPLPTWAERPVACFRCIADGRVGTEALAPGSADIAHALVSGRLESPLDGEPT